MLPRIIWIIFLAASAYILLSANIAGLDIYALDEARNAGCAREMWEQQEWIVPTFNYELREQKPPLHYYFMMFAYSLFGFGEFAARFFSVIFGVFTILATYFFAGRYLSESAARWASAVLLVSTHFSIQIHMAVPDPYLIFFSTVGAFSLFVGYQEGKFDFSLAGYVMLGLAVLCKGPIGMVMSGLGIFLFLVFSGRFTWKNIIAFRPFMGLLLMLAVAVPWYLAVHYATEGVWTEAFFYRQNLERFSRPMEDHGGIFLITWAFVLIGLLPFSIYLFQSLILAWQQRTQHQVLLYCLMMGAGILLIFSISSTKLPNYTVPLYPFWAILIGYYLANFDWNVVSKWAITTSLVLFVLLTVVLPVGVYVGLGFDKELADKNYLGFYFAFLPLGGIASMVFFYRKKIQQVFITQALSFAVLNLVFFWLAFPVVDRENPVYVARKAIDLRKPIVAYGAFNPAFVFYAQKEIKEYKDIAAIKEALSKMPSAYIITRKSNADSLKVIPSIQLVLERKDIFEIPTTVLFEKK